MAVLPISNETEHRTDIVIKVITSHRRLSYETTKHHSHLPPPRHPKPMKREKFPIRITRHTHIKLLEE